MADVADKLILLIVQLVQPTGVSQHHQFTLLFLVTFDREA